MPPRPTSYNEKASPRAEDIPLEQSLVEARFERIEAAHESLAKAIGAFDSDTRDRLGKSDNDVHALFTANREIADTLVLLAGAQR